MASSNMEIKLVKSIKLLPVEIVRKIEYLYCVQRYKECIDKYPLKIVNIVRELTPDKYDIDRVNKKKHIIGVNGYCTSENMLKFSKLDRTNAIKYLLIYSLNKMSDDEITNFISEHDVSNLLTYNMFKICIERINEFYISFLMNSHIACRHITEETIILAINRCDETFIASFVESNVMVENMNSLILMKIFERVSTYYTSEILSIDFIWKHMTRQIGEYVINKSTGTILSFDKLCAFLNEDLLKVCIAKSSRAYPPVIYYNGVFPYVTLDIFNYALDVCENLEAIIYNPQCFHFLTKQILKKVVTKIKITKILFFDEIKELVDEELFIYIVQNSLITEIYDVICILKTKITEEVMYAAINKMWGSDQIYETLKSNITHMSTRIIDIAISKILFEYVIYIFDNEQFLKYITLNSIKLALCSFGSDQIYDILNSNNVKGFLSTSLIEYGILNSSDLAVKKMLNNPKFVQYFTNSVFNLIRHTHRRIDIVEFILSQLNTSLYI